MDPNHTYDISRNFSILRKLDEEKWNVLLPLIVCLGVLMFLGIVGNCLVGFVWYTKMTRSSTNVCVLLLASFDLLTCLVGIPLDIYELTIHYTFANPAFCKTFRFIIDFTVYGSITVLIFIAVIRYLKVCKPLKNFSINSNWIIAVSLLIGVALSSPVLILHGLEEKPTKFAGLVGKDCGINENLKGGVYANTYFAFLGFVFFSSCAVLTALYVCIAIQIFRRKRRRTQSVSLGQLQKSEKSSSRPLSSESQRIQRSVTSNSVMFCTITLVFVISFLPSLVVLSFKANMPDLEAHLTDGQFLAYMLFFRTYFINNCINPLLYGFWNRKFREECVKLLPNCTQCYLKDKERMSATENISQTAPPKDEGKSHTLRPPSAIALDKSSVFSDSEEDPEPKAKSQFYV